MLYNTISQEKVFLMHHIHYRILLHYHYHFILYSILLLIFTVINRIFFLSCRCQYNFASSTALYYFLSFLSLQFVTIWDTISAKRYQAASLYIKASSPLLTKYWPWLDLVNIENYELQFLDEGRSLHIRQVIKLDHPTFTYKAIFASSVVFYTLINKDNRTFQYFHKFYLLFPKNNYWKMYFPLSLFPNLLQYFFVWQISIIWRTDLVFFDN